MRSVWLWLTLFSGFQLWADDGGVSNSSFLDNKNWSFRYFQIGSLSNDRVKYGGSPYSSYNYVYAKKRFDYETSLRLAFPFTFSTPGRQFFGYNQKGVSFERQDLFIGYIDKTLFLIPGLDIGSYSEFRFYFPTSERSIEIGQIGRLRADFIMSMKTRSPIWLQSWVKLNYYLQTNTVIQKTGRGEDGEYFKYYDTPKQYRLEFPLEVLYVKPKFTTGLGAKIQRDIHFRASNQLKVDPMGDKNRDKFEGGFEDKFSWGPRVSFNLLRSLRMQVNLEQEFIVGSRSKTLRKFGVEQPKVQPVRLDNDDAWKLTFLVWAGFADIL